MTTFPVGKRINPILPQKKQRKRRDPRQKGIPGSHRQGDNRHGKNHKKSEVNN